jgi:prolyl-tRNA editing enzyme YbaK/EbsC (Cys-tRNA(Pro) deacylase)
VKEAIRRKRVQDSGESMTALKTPAVGGDGQVRYGEQLRATLTSMHLWFRFIEFDEPVKTVAQAAGKVQAEKIAKSIVMIDSNGDPLLAIVPALSMVSHRKLKALLNVRDVRLANAREVLQHSGYPVGGVPPFNKIKRILLDQRVLQDEIAVVGGGDINKLLEIRTKDIVTALNPEVADISKNPPPEPQLGRLRSDSAA